MAPALVREPFHRLGWVYEEKVDGWRTRAASASDWLARLEDVVAGSELVFPVRRLAPDGMKAWKQVVERGYEEVPQRGRAPAASPGGGGTVAPSPKTTDVPGGPFCTIAASTRPSVRG
jgi:hypothetical protein